MTFGIVGLGRMGAAIASRAKKAGYTVYGFDRDQTIALAAQQEGIHITQDLAQLAQQATIIWLMVPAGAVVDAVINELLSHITPSHTIIDGGNSHFFDSQRRAQLLAARNIVYLDCGTSGGIHGKEDGFSLMVGGDKKSYEQLLSLLKAIAAPDGVGYVGPSGAGHYVKMVHNGIEYALMQGYAEGFQLLKEGSFKEQHLDLEEISRIWNHGAVIRSWLLELAHTIFSKDQELTTISGRVEESGTGRWTVDDAHKHHVPVPVIEESLLVRARSREQGGNYATKVVAMLRNAFGGHKITVLTKK